MSCFATTVRLVQNNRINKFNVGPCTEYMYQVVWNADVTKFPMASNGAVVQLTDAAFQEVKARYTGEPLIVKFRAGCCQICCVLPCLECLPCCKPNTSCCKLSCGVPLIADLPEVDTIYFGRQNRRAQFPGCLGSWCCRSWCLLCDACGTNTMYLHPFSISLPSVNLGQQDATQPQLVIQHHQQMTMLAVHSGPGPASMEMDAKYPPTGMQQYPGQQPQLTHVPQATDSSSSSSFPPQYASVPRTSDSNGVQPPTNV